MFTFSDKMMDYSVRVDNLDGNEINSRLLDTGTLPPSQNKERLRKLLAKILKKDHPLHKMVKTFSIHDLNKLSISLSLPYEKSKDRKKKRISDHFFQEYQDAPLTNLKRVLEEDAYFAHLLEDANGKPNGSITFDLI